MSPILYYVHDPMCSWCWAFRPALLELRANLPDSIAFLPLLGGLAPDSNEPMPEPLRQYLQDTWRRIQERVPGTRFNFAFWRRCNPKRSTYPACRALIAARQQHPGFEESILLAIQRAYYLEARNPSEIETLVTLAGDVGLDQAAFRARLDDPTTHATLQGEISRARGLGVRAFPALIFATRDGRWPVAIDYNDPGSMLETIRHLRYGRP